MSGFHPVTNKKDNSDQRNDANNWAQTLSLGKRDSTVESKCKTKSPHNVDGSTIIKSGHGPRFRELIHADKHDNEKRQSAKWRHESELPYRRPRPPARSVTSSVAHGSAFRRSFGIGFPDTNE